MSRSHKFSAAFGPVANPAPPAGMAETVQGSITGKLTCDSGVVHWTATQ
jgi:hypothetical protein